MINYESILSSYDDKLTLMQWLKKVEAALAASVLTGVNVTQDGDVVTLSFDFEDGTKIVAPSFRVNQQITGVQVVNGELVFSLSNGQTINAGNLLDGNPLIIPAVNVIFNGNVTTEGFLTAEAGVSTPSLTCDGEQINAQKPVVELMNGYSVVKETAATNHTFDWRYIGVCKNANKLTIAGSLSISMVAAVSGTTDIRLMRVNLPSAIANKLIPYAQGTFSNMLAQIKCVCSDSVDSISTFLSNVNVRKNTSTQLTFNLFPNQTLAADHTYNLRFEVTFLLSENLAA